LLIPEEFQETMNLIVSPPRLPFRHSGVRIS
jgi:hypothetical protein